MDRLRIVVNSRMYGFKLFFCEVASEAKINIKKRNQNRCCIFRTFVL